MKKIITILLSVLLAFSTFVGCAQGEQGAKGENKKTTTWTGRGVHEAEVKERTNEYIVDDGKTDYKIVIPAKAMDYEVRAAELIVQYVQESTGVSIPVLSDGTALAHNGKYISLGDTTLMRNSGISVPLDKFGESGFKIYTKGDIIFISGARSNTRQGTYYGAQEFLYYTVDWRAYTAEDIFFEKRPKITLADYDIIEIPEFDCREIHNNGTAFNNPAWSRNLRLGVRENAEYEGKISTTAHSHFEVLPPELYFEEHPDWYAYEPGKDYYTDPGFYVNAQLCLSNEEMTNAFIDSVVEMFKNNPEDYFIHLGTQDNLFFCDCQNCKDMQQQYHTNVAGLNVIFTNKVARGVTAVMSEIDPMRKLYFEMFAYYATIEPPVYKNEKGEWVADHPDVIPDKNVFVQFTPLGRNTLKTVFSEENEKYDRYMQGWVAIADNISVYDYNANFSNFILPFKDWDVMTEQIRYYAENKATRIYLQGSIGSVTNMFELRTYVQAKLLWNPALSYNELAEDFIKHFYGDAAENISQAYNATCTYYEWLMDTYNPKTWELDNTEKDYFTFSFVESVRMVMREAFESIEHLKEIDAIEYEKYYWRVCAVYLENMYMQLDFHMGRYDTAYIAETINLFESTTARYGVVYIQEGSDTKTVAKYLEKWRGYNA